MRFSPVLCDMSTRTTKLDRAIVIASIGGLFFCVGAVSFLNFFLFICSCQNGSGWYFICYSHQRFMGLMVGSISFYSCFWACVFCVHEQVKLARLN